MRRVILGLLLLVSTDFANSAIVFRDNFEYDVSRSDSGTCSRFSSSGGWGSVKSVNCTGSHNGYLYTSTTIPGYSGSFPGSSSSRVLGIEARPRTMGSQTDFYLEFGTPSGPIGQIPANHWYQFWIYSNYYGDQLSQYGPGKFLYPNRSTFYPGTGGNTMYIVSTVKTSDTPLDILPCGEDATVGCDRAFLLTGWDSGRGLTNNIPYRERNFGQNLSTENILLPNTWTLIKIHFDLSGTDPRATPGQAVHEQWIRRKGSSQWIKTTEYIGGVTISNGSPINLTPSFNDGYRTLRMPTTVGNTTAAETTAFDYWIYLDDFVIASSEADLPVYNDGGSSSALSSPTNLRFVP